MRFSLKSNWIQIHVTFPFLTVQSLLFQNSLNRAVTPNITYLLLLLEIQNFNSQSSVKRGEWWDFYTFIQDYKCLFQRHYKCLFHSTLEKTRSLQVACWNNDGTSQIYGCKCSFEIKICFKYKYLSNTLYICNLWLHVLF